MRAKQVDGKSAKQLDGKSASVSRTGRFVLLCNLLGLGGGAPKTNQARSFTLATLLVIFAALGSAAAPALASSPLPPSIASARTSAVDSEEATLEAQINPNNEATNYTFEYATAEAAGELTGTIVKVNGASLLEGSSDQTASVPTGAVLAAGTTYFYRVVAENAQSKIEGKPVVFPVKAVDSFTTPPTPSATTVTPVTATYAQFHGRLTPLNPNVPAQYHFDYKLGSGGCTGEGSTPSIEAGKGAGGEAAATMSADEFENGIQPNQEYTVCLVTSNAFGSSQPGPAAHFTTLRAPLNILGETVSSVTASEATLKAEINPNNEETTYAFEYATNQAFTDATTVPGASPLEGYGDDSVSAAVTGLKTGETYYYRVVAENETSKEAGQPVEGAPEHFEALGEPRVASGEALSVTSVSAELSGTLDVAGLPTSYHFAYVPAAEYEAGAPNPYAKGAVTPEGSATPGDIIDYEIFEFVAELKPGETYDYALVATNELGGPVMGANQVFTTEADPQDPPAPLVSTGPGVTSPSSDFVVPSANEGASASVKIEKYKVTASSIAVTIKTSEPGIVTTMGSGLKKTVKTLVAGTHEVTVPLTKAGKIASKGHKRIKLSVSLKTNVKTVSASDGVKL